MKNKAQIITNQFQQEIKQHGSYPFPFLISHEQLSGYQTGAFLWHWHPELELTLVREGEMRYQINATCFHLLQGQALLANANVLHTGQMIRHQDCLYTAITFDPRLLYGYENSLMQAKYIRPFLLNAGQPFVYLDGSQEWHQQALQTAHQLVQAGECRESLYEFEIQICLLRFWKLLLAHSDTKQLGIGAIDAKNSERIRSILSYIEQHFRGPLELQDISNHIHLCKSECCRLFKRYMRQPLFAYLLQLRIEKSLVYILDSKYSITDAALNVGFSDSNYFSKVFHRLKGCSPTQYRKQAWEQAKAGKKQSPA